MARTAKKGKKLTGKRQVQTLKLAQPAKGKPPQRSKLSQSELDQILAAHKKWLETKGKQGERADLLGANLQEADLRLANLQGAYLFEVKAVTASQIKRATNWRLAFYSDDFLAELDLPADHNETVKKKLAEIEKEKEKTAASP